MISPLLANMYLHWFEHRVPSDRTAPAHGPRPSWCGTRMTSSSWPVTRADACSEWVESTLEGRFQLAINRDKTAW